MKTHECKIACTRLELLSDGTLLRGIELCEHNLGFLLGQDACSLGVLRGQGWKREILNQKVNRICAAVAIQLLCCKPKFSSSTIINVVS